MPFVGEGFNEEACEQQNKQLLSQLQYIYIYIYIYIAKSEISECYLYICWGRVLKEDAYQQQIKQLLSQL